MKVSVEKPGSPEEVLEHHGTRGMKWGVRQRSTRAGIQAGKSVSKQVRAKGGSRREARNAGAQAQRTTRESTRQSLNAHNKGVMKDKAKSVGSGAKSGVKSVGRGLKRAGKATGRGIDNTAFELSKGTQGTAQHITGNASKKLRADLPGIKAKHPGYSGMKDRVKKPFSKEAKAYRTDVKKSYLKHLESAANETTNISGSRRYTLTDRGKPNTSQYFWKVQTQSVKHADDGSFTVRPIFDDEGFIVDVELVEDNMKQTMDRGLNFLMHMGINRK